MINILPSLTHIELIKVKHPVPQVGSKILNYSNLKELESNMLYDFVVNTSGDLKIGKGHYKLNDRGDTLYFAGRLKVNKTGKICYVDNESGHYIPTKIELLHFVGSIKRLAFIDEDVKLRHVKTVLQ